jgi:AraC-like DNA-binding protein
MARTYLQDSLQSLLREKLIPWTDAKSPFLLVQPPLIPPPGIKVSNVKARALPVVKQHTSHLTLYNWREDQLNALRVPYLGCVVEGEADLKTGITSRQARQLPPDMRQFGRQIMALPAGSFFILPPGGIISNANKVHWERNKPEDARSKSFWIHLIPAGAICHLCSCRNGEHTIAPFLFVRDAQLEPMAQFLLHQMQMRLLHHEEIALAQLKVLLLHLDQAMSRNETQILHSSRKMEETTAMPPDAPRPQEASAQDPLSLACQFIENHFHLPALAPAQIAQQCYLSVPHLNRLFRKQFDQSIMEYVRHTRLAHGERLLRGTNFTINEIARLSGYHHLSHFSQAFSDRYHCSPQAFRQKILRSGIAKKKS